jgi:hypothetical protein
MKKAQTSPLASNKRLIGILITVPVLLLIPYIAMKFGDEVKWTLIDFIAAGTLLLGAGLTFELVMRKVRATKLKVVISILILITFFLLWAELAVGIFGSPIAGH